MDAARLDNIHHKILRLVEPQNYRLGLNLYLDSFTGEEVHQKLMEHELVSGSAEADIVCTLMLRRGWLRHVESDAQALCNLPFDTTHLYRFADHHKECHETDKPLPISYSADMTSQQRRKSAQRGLDLFVSGLHTETSRSPTMQTEKKVKDNASQMHNSCSPFNQAYKHLENNSLSSEEDKNTVHAHTNRPSHHARSATVPNDLIVAAEQEPAGQAHNVVSTFWTLQEDQALVEGVSKYGEDWGFVAHNVVTKNESQCEMRWLEKLRDAKLTHSNRNLKDNIRILRNRKARKAKKVYREQFEEAQRGALTAEYLRRKDQLHLERQQHQKLGTPESVGRRRAMSTDQIDMLDSAAAMANIARQGEIAQAIQIANGERSAVGNDRPTTPQRWMSSREDAKAWENARMAPEPVVALESNDGIDASERINLPIIVMGLSNPPDSSRGLRETHYVVKIFLENSTRYAMTNAVVRKPNSGITWGELLVLEDITYDSLLDIRLFVRHRLIGNEEVGRTEITVGELVRRPARNLVLSNSSANVVTDSTENNVTLLKIGVDKSAIPKSWPMPVNEPYSKRGYPKHLMVITRGTRGDVQPFLALARELANRYNWMITICSEFRYKDYIKQNAKGLKRGCIRFRIAGGDTQKRVDSRISKWAINQQYGPMQEIMLAFSEREFFDSEPPLYYWAKVMKPDYLMFGFTLASIAMIISESLQIPIIGFILQPTCLPSSQYPPLVPLDESSYQKLTEKTDRKDRKHAKFSHMKVMLENNPITGHLNSMRARRGLRPVRRFTGRVSILQSMQSSTWTDLQLQEVPLVVPINSIAFGGRPHDWGPKSVLTNYIFLRGRTVPPLDSKHVDFIEQARSKGRKLIVLAFSSMPVERLDILRIANKIISQCEKEVCIFALIGDHVGDPGNDGDVEGTAAAYTTQGRLLVDKGAPFGRLFPLMDAIVSHGGLGTTGEAIMACVPVIITGVLLFDQRFWGSRCHDLGLGPFPVHITKFKTQCVHLIDKALADDGEWATNAKTVGKKMFESMESDPAGVAINAEAVYEMTQEAPVFSYEHGPSSSAASGSNEADDDTTSEPPTYTTGRYYPFRKHGSRLQFFRHRRQSSAGAESQSSTGSHGTQGS